MAVSYNKLWKKLIDLGMSKGDLRVRAGISTRQLAKLGKNEHVNTEILAKRLKVDPINLPQVIYDEFGDCTGTSRLSDIEYVFKEILDFILDRGVKYKLSSK